MKVANYTVDAQAAIFEIQKIVERGAFTRL